MNDAYLWLNQLNTIYFGVEDYMNDSKTSKISF